MVKDALIPIRRLWARGTPATRYMAMNSYHSDPTHAGGAPVTTQTRVHDIEGSSCGEFLRRARERRRLTLQEIAQSTKIPLRHLNALERDDFDALPSGMYRRAEVRAYADAVGLDRGVALARLDRALEPEMPRPVSEPPPRFASGRVRALIAAGVAVTTGVILLAMWGRQPASGDIASPTAPVPTAASSVVPAPYIPNHVLVATSGSAVELASASPDRRIEPASVPSESNAEPPMEPSDATTAAASRLEPQLTVITEPAGARVTVNGVGWGITPVTIRYLEPGAKRVRVTMDGYRAEERSVHVGAVGPAATLRIPLQNAD